MIADRAPPTPDALLDRWVSDATRAAQAGDWPKAIRFAEHALGLGLEHPRLLHMRSIGRDRAGRRAEALSDLKRAHQLDPDDMGVANALGVGLTRIGDHGAAIGVLELAAAGRPDIADSHFNLGAARMAGGDLIGARSAFERAAALDPGATRAFGKLALLASHRGDRHEARRNAQRALSNHPTDPDAQRALIETHLDDRRFTEAETLARTWLALPALGLNGRHYAQGLLGDALDGQARYAEAFQAYSDSNSSFRTLHSKTFQAVDRAPLRSTLKAMEDAFGQTKAEDWAPAPKLQSKVASPRSHVFLMGFMRSGTTLLEQALSGHPDVVTLEETEAMADAGAAHLGRPGGFRHLIDLNGDDADRYRAAYWAAVRAAGIEPNNKVFVDKLPFNGSKLPLIAKLFPEAKIIFALRDPRDVVFSCFQRRLQPNAYAYEMASLDGAARLYDAYMSLVSRYRADLPLRILDHRHEALVSDFQASVREICDFSGLQFTPDMIAFGTAASGGQVLSQTARQLQGGLSAKGVGRWRVYASELAPVLPILHPWTAAFGYPSS